MVVGILLAFSAAVIYGVLGVTFELAGKRKYRVWDFILAKQFVGFCIGICCTVFLGISVFDVRLFALGLIGAVAYVLTLAFYLVASREKNIATNWTIVNLSVVVPIFASVVWFHDVFSFLKGAGIVLTIFSILVIGGASAKASGKETSSSHWMVHIGMAFLLNGVLVVLFRFVPEREGPLFTVYFYGISFLLIIPYKLIADRRWRFERGLLAVSAAGAVTHWSGMMLTIAALAHVGQVSKQAGVIVYPITNGLVIPIGVILGSILLRQSITRRTAFGVGVGIVALICLFI